MHFAFVLKNTQDKVKIADDRLDYLARKRAVRYLHFLQEVNGKILSLYYSLLLPTTVL